MASQQELANSALQHALKTSWTWDKYLARIRDDPSYQYENTEWYAAGDDLEKAKHPGGDTPPPKPPPGGDLSDAQARIFLAQSPLDCLAAPSWMVPVCTADLGYRYWYDPNTISQLRAHFGRVEAWCDCRNPTPYSEAQKMVTDMGLDGPAWGQCETSAEFEHGYDGKWVIHPSQIAPVHLVFTPSPAEIERAKRILAAPQGAVRFEGELIDEASRRLAESLLSRAALLPSVVQPMPERN